MVVGGKFNLFESLEISWLTFKFVKYKEASLKPALMTHGIRIAECGMDREDFKRNIRQDFELPVK
jgi:hypothetical protein